ncbi:hypothetical protein FisN_19Hh229 [Fistulifera solaris]|uniref:V-SNARE coiled-coil homology domain-containing protein n=1 Tax=Fistulifera solaris TaxID=1519565 RepID=A0A1Z5K071_FISSO|nr:hypothetical protein FisN_19Hh229 [Fistulifera solaris]|eukprot:GAX19647.1 hypothetical protein FisN_19Hh229 [Fistulifera solaris]
MKERPKILWSCIARNHVVLVETGSDDPAVRDTAQGLLARRATPGYEFYHQRRRLRGCKFHIYEHTQHADVDEEEDESSLLIWVFAAVYDASVVTQVQVQAFLQKIVQLTELLRHEDPEWRSGYNCQSTFAPILQQRMEDITHLAKIVALEQQLETTRAIMERNIELILDREERLLRRLHEKASEANEMAQIFRKRTRKVRRMQLMQQAKHGIVVGTAITLGVAIAVVPVVVAL